MKEKVGEESPNFFSLLFMCWVNRILKLGSQHDLNEDDLYPIIHEDEAEKVISEMEIIWKKELENAKRNKQKPRLWKAVLKSFTALSILQLIALRFLDSFGKAIQVVVLCLYLEFLQKPVLQDDPRGAKYAALFIFGITSGSLVKLFGYHHCDLQTLYHGMRIKIGLTGIIYKKILYCTRSDLTQVTGGYLMNLVSNDAKRMEELVSHLLDFFRVFWDSTFVIIVISVVVGWQCFIAFLFFGAVVILVMLLSRKAMQLREEQCVITDQRLSAMNEIISGIRALKVNAWEWNYRDRVAELRRREVTKIRNRLLIQSNMLAFTLVSASIAILAAIITLMHAGIRLSPATIFTLSTALSLLNMSYGGSLPNALYFTFDSIVSLERMEGFLLRENYVSSYSSAEDAKGENEGALLSSSEFTTSCPEEHNLRNGEDPHIYVNGAWTSWRMDCPRLNLRAVNMNASSTQLIIVTGHVGSGKSSLLLSILGEIPVKQGSVKVNGKIAYASQTPWIFSDTIRANILFGKPFDEKRYDDVIRVCSLQEDIKRFPKGDLSMIGQRGVSLSGGQRSRVSLARAVYSDADIFLLDDPLSAVDPKVGKQIFDECISGALSNRLRILATHQLQHLYSADHIMVLKSGRVVTQGTYNEVQESAALGELMKEVERTQFVTPQGHDETSNEVVCVTGCRDFEEEIEDRVSGIVTWSLYWEYLRSGLPTPILCLVIGTFVAVQGSVIAPFWWLSKISRMSPAEQNSTYTLGIFTGLTGGAVLFSFIRTSLFSVSISRSSEKILNKMTLAVIKAQVLFFDTNSVGRIMNRFSKDTGAMDDLLPLQLYISSAMLLQAIAILVLTVIVNPWFILVVVPLMIVTVIIVMFYLKTARSLQRLEGQCCSPLFAHVSDTIVGIESIHSYNMEKDFIISHIRNQNLQTRAYRLVVATSRWAGIQVDLVCTVFVFFIATGSVVLKLDAAVSGLLLMFSVIMMGMTQYGFRLATKVECLMTSVERVIAYTKIQPEPGYSRSVSPPEHWPNQGALQIRDLSLQYLEGGVQVLEGVSLNVQPQEKVGIVGRTGAGKSSLVAALFRMPEPQGQVLIDGIDLGSINVQAARKAMAVITQEPVIFAGSLRSNIDPFESVTDLEIWTAVEDVQMKESVSHLPGGLSFELGESGSGFSVGEKQLLCLARALLQKCKLLVLDEATANVDYKTDRLVQQVIREKFAKCTVLTIAHRINTIMDYDKVVVMKKGHVIESGSPQVLAGKTGGAFAHLVNAAFDNGSRANVND